MKKVLKIGSVEITKEHKAKVRRAIVEAEKRNKTIDEGMKIDYNAMNLRVGS